MLEACGVSSGVEGAYFDGTLLGVVFGVGLIAERVGFCGGIDVLSVGV